MSRLIERAKLTDVDVIDDIERSSFSHPWPTSLLREELKRAEPDGIWVMRNAKDGVLGFLSVRTLVDELEILSVAVQPSHRGQGLGKELVLKAIAVAREERCERVLLEVRESNGVAQRLYERLGFETVGRRPNYYQQPPEDAILCTLHLNARGESPAGPYPR